MKISEELLGLWSQVNRVKQQVTVAIHLTR